MVTKNNSDRRLLPQLPKNLTLLNSFIKFSLLLATILNSTYALSDSSSLIHTLEGNIIRSYAFNSQNPNLVLVGIKGEKKGSGKVYLSNDAGLTWKVTNGDSPLTKTAEDVQSVSFVDDNLFLAGTWKNGLFKSNDAGKSWTAVVDFPSKDIRAIKVGKKNNSQILIATTTANFIKSNDKLKSWKQQKTKEMASWDLIVDPMNDQILYALTFAKGIQRSSDYGESWTTIRLPEKDTMIYDLAINKDGTIVAVGFNDKSNLVSVSQDNGKTWASMKNLPLAMELNSVELVDSRILVGSWDDGVHEYKDGVWSKLIDIKVKEITKIKRSGSFIYYFTWENGIYMEKI